MSRLTRGLSYAGAVLTANALRPAHASSPLGVPSFFAGWLATELAPYNLALTAAATGLQLKRNGQPTNAKDRVALALNGATMAGLVVIIRQSLASKQVVEDALRETFPDIEPAEADERMAAIRRHANPFGFGHPGVEVIRDVQYAGKGRRRRLDIFRPRKLGDTPAPVLFQIHGGAWMIGKKEEQALPLLYHLASRGWVCVSANYRLVPKVRWPDQLIDVKSALAWIRTNIEDYGGDPGFVAVTGGSAGGHLASLVALTANDPRYQPGFEDVDTSVQACVPHYGVYDLADELKVKGGVRTRDRFYGPMLFKANYATNPEPFNAASPLQLTHADAPPFFVIHGTHDSLAPVAEAREFVNRLRAISKAPVAYAELPGTQHAFDIFHSIRSANVVRAVERFLGYTHVAHTEELTKS